MRTLWECHRIGSDVLSYTLAQRCQISDGVLNRLRNLLDGVQTLFYGFFLLLVLVVVVLVVAAQVVIVVGGQQTGTGYPFEKPVPEGRYE